MFTTGPPSTPEILSISIIERDMGDSGECMVNVEWTEAMVSCGGSVSKYQVSVTPSVFNCESQSPDEDCLLTSEETELNLILSGGNDYSLSVRPSVFSCSENLEGEFSEPLTVNFGGK